MPLPGEQDTDEAARLEAALSRIQAAVGGRKAANAPTHGEPDRPARPQPDLSHIAARLDELIAELRSLLAPQP